MNKSINLHNYCLPCCDGWPRRAASVAIWMIFWKKSPGGNPIPPSVGGLGKLALAGAGPDDDELSAVVGAVVDCWVCVGFPDEVSRYNEDTKFKSGKLKSHFKSNKVPNRRGMVWMTHLEGFPCFRRETSPWTYGKLRRQEVEEWQTEEASHPLLPTSWCESGVNLPMLRYPWYSLSKHSK